MFESRVRKCDNRHRRLHLLIGLLALVCLLGAMAPAQADIAGAGRGDVVLISLDSIKGNYSLAGQWQFQPGDDTTWASPGYNDSGWSNAAVPQLWPLGGYPQTGQLAWYRLTLKFDLHDVAERRHLDGLAVRMGKVLSAYEIYAGGKLLGGVGKLPPLSEVDYDRQRVYRIPLEAISQNGTLVLALRVWGGDAADVASFGSGPFEGEFSLGDYRVLLLDGIISEMPGLLFSVLFIGFGLYYLYLHRRNSQLRTYLWFGLMAVSIGIYGLMLSQWKYLLDWPFVTLKKIELGVIYMFPALVIQMGWALLEQPITRWLRAYQVSFIALSLLVVAVPGHAIHYYTLAYWQLWTLPILVLAPWMVVREARAGKGEARTVLVGLLIFVATCVNDLLIDLTRLQTTRLISYGFVAFMLSMAVSLANRFTAMLNELEHEVNQRTAELSAANALLAEAARVDPLTGLLNRRGFTEEADAEVRRVLRSGRGFTVILGDVDNFKRFNDNHGHACGDHVLKRVAAIFGANVRDVDRVARWGGEEFILLLPETGLEGGAALAEKLRQGIADNMFEFGGQRLSITITFGVASHSKGESLDTCIARADTALYCGKEQGRNKVMVGNYKELTLVS